MTVDEKTETWLTRCYTPHDADKPAEEFLFMYKQVPMPLQAISFRDEARENTINWEVTRLDISNVLLDEKETIKELIRTAFETYKALGWPDEKNQKINATCSFRKRGDFEI